MFKKIKFLTHENIGSGPINLPPQEMHTTAFFISFFNLSQELSQNDIESGLLGLCNVMINIAPLYLMCDPRDICGVSQIKSPFTGKPTIYIYDNYPGGVGFSEKLYGIEENLLKASKKMILECSCDGGCPSCVGPIEEIGVHGKNVALKIIDEVLCN